MSKQKKPKVQYNKSTLFKMTLPYMKKSWYLIIISIIFTIILAYLTTYAPLLTKTILDDYINNDALELSVRVTEINRLLMIYAAVILISVVFRYFLQYFITLTSMRIEKGVRDEAIEKINYLPVDYFSLEPDGKIVAKITADSNGVRNFYSMLFSITQAIITIIAVYIGIFILDYRMALYMLIATPFILLWITVYRHKVHNYFTLIREIGSKITGKLNELISGALIIQAFNQEEHMLEDYKELITDYNKNDAKVNTISAYLGYELLIFIKRVIEAGILIFFGFKYLTLGGVIITIGLVTTFTTLLDRMIQPINTIFNNLNDLEDSIVAANRVYAFINEPDDTRVKSGSKCLGIEGEVEFKDVSFSYVENTYVLKNVDLKVEKGKTIGVVGHTGSGKSSMMNILLGYNDNQLGQILVDGVDIKEYNKQSYRQYCGIVLQTPALFAGTIKSNITMQRDIYTDEEVVEVLNKVGASYMLEKSSHGIYSPISFKGENLSLGEKQLIGFARILLRNPKILVLDEATANIDSETELRIKNAMNVITKGRTTFIIAHRLSTIKDADEIVVLDHGNIVGKGTHDSLYETCSIYKEMYDGQYQETKKKMELSH